MYFICSKVHFEKLALELLFLVQMSKLIFWTVYWWFLIDIIARQTMSSRSYSKVSDGCNTCVTSFFVNDCHLTHFWFVYPDEQQSMVGSGRFIEVSVGIVGSFELH